MRTRKSLILVIISLIAFGLTIGFFEYESRLGHVRVSDLRTYTSDGEVLVTWSISGNQEKENIYLAITDLTEDVGAEQILLEPNQSYYVHKTGIHGHKYRYDIQNETQTESMTENQTEAMTEAQTAMFVSFDKCPDIPLLIIDTEDGLDPTYKVATKTDENTQLGETLTANDYKKAKFTCFVKPDKYGQGQKTDVRSEVQIRVRGNTSSVLYDKKSYKLLFSEPTDLLELGEDTGDGDVEPRKRTEWVLLPNADNIRNFLGYTVSDICGVEWQLQMRYVNLLLNGDYLGTYVLTESVGKESAGNLVSDTGYIFENDIYWWNTDGMFFRTTHQDRTLAYTVRYPEVTRNSNRFLYLSDYMEDFDNALFAKGVENEELPAYAYSDYIDMDSFVSWIMARDVLCNSDGGGSNMYFYKYDYDPENPLSSKVKMGPLWDFDLIFVTEGEWSASRGEDAYFFPQLFERPDFDELYRNKWLEIHDDLAKKVDSRVHELMANDGVAINESWKLDSTRWDTDFYNISIRCHGQKFWLENRVKWMDEQLLLNK